MENIQLSVFPQPSILRMHDVHSKSSKSFYKL